MRDMSAIDEIERERDAIYIYIYILWSYYLGHVWGVLVVTNWAT